MSDKAIKLEHAKTLYDDLRQRNEDLASSIAIALAGGYMEMEIVNGHLIFRRMEISNTDFRLEDGHLIMEVE